MTENYKTFIKEHLNEDQIRYFNLNLQNETSLTNLYKELINYGVDESICDEIIPELNLEDIRDSDKQASELLKQGKSENEVENILLESGFHIGIASNAIENHLYQNNKINEVNETSSNFKYFRLISSILCMYLGLSNLNSGNNWYSIFLIVFSVISFIWYTTSD